MTDDRKHHQDGARNNGHLAGHLPRVRAKESDDEAGEGSCAAFGYLRGIRDRAEAIEVRFQSGNSIWFPYTWLGNWQFNPSDGLLLKFSGDVVYLVLIRGSNLDQPLADTNTNLTTSGLQRHRIVWIREMTDEEIRQVGETGPTIDSIQIEQFETQESLNEWLQKKAPSFLH
ncbi:MAG: hypothetical protein JWP89_4393 [Schlesneria sp.]|nr:hypothetical protein [Schlesneria sp.]